MLEFKTVNLLKIYSKQLKMRFFGMFDEVHLLIVSFLSVNVQGGGASITQAFQAVPRFFYISFYKQIINADAMT